MPTCVDTDYLIMDIHMIMVVTHTCTIPIIIIRIATIH